MHNPEQQLESKDSNKNSKKIDTSGSSIPHWVEATNDLVKKELNQKVKLRLQAQKSRSKEQKKPIDVATKLAETVNVKKAGLQFLVEHDLPRYKKIIVNLQEFLRNPQKTFNKLVSETGLYYSSIINLKTGARIFRLGQRREEVKKFILEKLASQEISLNSELTLSEYWHNYFGGNLLINKNGGVLVELVEGKHAKLPKGEGQVLMSAETDPYTNVLKFDNNFKEGEELQIKLRQAIVRTLELIPKKRVPLNEKVLARFSEAKIDEEGQKYVELPYDGYFEFILTKKSEEEELKAIFIDARTGRAADKYQLIE